jgi:hypothetical protein
MDTLLKKIEERFNSCTQEDVVYGYTYIHDFMMMRSFQDYQYSDKCILIIELLYEYMYQKAEKYNNSMKSDYASYEIDINRLIKMCEVIIRYNKDVTDEISDRIPLYWSDAEEVARLNLIGYICVKNNLPGGDPCWIGSMIKDYVC